MKRSFRVEKAEGFIRSLIKREDLAPRTRLPSLSRLAGMAGVSFVTMWKAVKRLKAQGVIAGQPHSRLMVGGESRNEMIDIAGEVGAVDVRGEGACGPRALSTANRIERDVLNGLYRPGQRLGSYKVLTNRYGVCFATMKSALARLLEKGVVQEDRKHFVVPHLSTSSSSTRIRLVGIDAPHEVLALGSVGGQFLQWIEMECVRSGVGLDIVSFHLGDDALTFTELASGKACDLQDTEDIQGYIYLIVAEVAMREEIYRRLQFFRKPVAVFDVTGVEHPGFISGDRNFRIFLTTAGMQPSVQVARFLAGRGHRSIAYFSPFHRGKWSQTRLRGLQRGFADAGYPGAVHPFLLDRITHSDYYPDSVGHPGLSSLLRRLQQWEKELPPAGALRFVKSGVRSSLEVECAGFEMRRVFAPFFEKALADPGITAWVGANDGIAGFALDFLSEKRVAVPGRVSVVGFDDDFAAMERRLTSYNFNISALAHAVLDYVLRRGGGPWTTRRQLVEIEGLIVERGTTHSKIPPAAVSYISDSVTKSEFHKDRTVVPGVDYRIGGRRVLPNRGAKK